MNAITEYSDLVLSQRIRLEFVKTFNSQLRDTKLLFEFPILVVAKLSFVMEGPSRVMDGTEKQYFAAFAERRVVEPFFEEQPSDEFTLRNANWEDTYPVDLGNIEGVGAELIVEADHQLAELYVLATCKTGAACTNMNFQSHLRANAALSLDSLFSAIRAVGNEVPYFSQIKSLNLLSRGDASGDSGDVGQNSHAVPPENTGNQTPITPEKQQIPLWVWMLVIADFAVLVGIFAYVSHRRSKRKVQGDKMKDSPEEKQNRRMSLQVTPFHQKPRSEEPVVKTAAQIEEEEYDARSYDFSIEAGELSDDDSEVDLSSFRRPRTKRF